MPPPAVLTVTYCTDEDVAKLAGTDWRSLVPQSFRVAYGKDGAFAGGAPWVLTSATVNFAVQGVLPNMVAILRNTAPVPATGPLGGSGELFAVESVTTNSLTLRRVGQPLYAGQPPVTAAATGIEFDLRTLAGQIEDVSYQLNEGLAVNPAISNRTPGDVYDLRVLRYPAVLAVVARQYALETRDDRGDFAKKAGLFAEQARDALDRASLRWGTTGATQPADTKFSMRVSR